MTAAHELAERGFEVHVVERRALGGKARSVSVPGTGGGGRRPLPGEHSWRSFFGLYRNLPDTLRRIPVPGTGRSVHDALGDATTLTLVRGGGREDLALPIASHGPPQSLSVDFAARELVAVLQTAGRLPPDEAAFLSRQLAIFISSSDERRYGQWEHMSWWDYVRAEDMSNEYRVIANFVPRAVALRPKLASARAVGRYYETLISFIAGFGQEGGADQVLNRPTNEAWIVPWTTYLRSRGVRFWRQTVDALELRRDRITAARVRDRRGHTRRLEADWFICALPIERARRLWSAQILSANPRLETMSRLQTIWGNGIQFYLRRQVPVARGHVLCVDSPWSVLSISQAQFWDRDFARTYGDGHAKDCLSVAVAEFDEPGVLYGKPARDCTADEFAREAWTQIKAPLEDTGRTYLPDDVLHSWFIDPGLSLPGPRRPRATNEDPLFLNSVGAWDNRPGVTTDTPNLLLAASYLQTNIDADTMEGANEAARKAVNALLTASGSSATPVPIHALYQAHEYDEAKRIDAQRYRAGQPHILDTPWPAT